MRMESKMTCQQTPQVLTREKCPWRQGKMYGMLLESIQYFIKKNYGDKNWDLILEQCGIKNMVFTTHKLYKDEIMLNLATSCSVILKDKTSEEYLSYFGECFVKFFSNYGYDKILRVSGRYYRDFLYGIDNLHEMMRFSYPHLQSPSFLVESEDCDGCILSYRSKRKGFLHYVLGQLKQCAKVFYDIDVDVITLYNNVTDTGCHVTLRLNFDNTPFVMKILNTTSCKSANFNPLSSSTFFKVFPFCMVFDHSLIIRHTGCKLNIILSDDDLIGFNILDRFKLRRPIMDFTWDNVISCQKVTFELQYLQPFYKRMTPPTIFNSCLIETNSGSKIRKPKYIFKGQMKYIRDWNMMAFLCTPLIGSLEDMERVSLFINDLSMYDNSREMVLAGSQHMSQLEYSVEQQIEKSKLIAENLEKLDEWRKKSDNLLYSMIPESIANRLKNGEDPINTCEMLEEVTILFCYIVRFTDICAQATALQIVECINDVFSSFDSLVDKYNCFKVETLGDAVYMVAGGVPDRRPDHAESVAGLALELLNKSKLHKDPVTGNNLSIRVGMHTGSVVAGIVGKRMPQYCLFGDAVNTASRMQSYSEPECIHLSEPCNDCLKGCGFVTVFRGTVNIKGKGEMKTYWLAGHEGDEGIEDTCAELRKKTRHRLQPKYKSFENGFDLHGMHSVTSTANFDLNFDIADDAIRLRRTSSTPGILKRSILELQAMSESESSFEQQTEFTLSSEDNRLRRSPSSKYNLKFDIFQSSPTEDVSMQFDKMSLNNDCDRFPSPKSSPFKHISSQTILKPDIAEEPHFSDIDQNCSEQCIDDRGQRLTNQARCSRSPVVRSDLISDAKGQSLSKENKCQSSPIKTRDDFSDISMSATKSDMIQKTVSEKSNLRMTECQSSNDDQDRGQSSSNIQNDIELPNCTCEKSQNVVKTGETLSKNWMFDAMKSELNSDKLHSNLKCFTQPIQNGHAYVDKNSVKKEAILDGIPYMDNEEGLTFMKS